MEEQLDTAVSFGRRGARLQLVWRALRIVGAAFVFLVVHQIRASLPYAIQGHHGRQEAFSGAVTLVVVRPWVPVSLAWAATVLAIVLALVCIKRILAKVAVVAAALAVHGGYSLVADWSGGLAFNECSSMRGADGRTYVFLDQDYLQDQVMALGVLEHEWLLARTYRVLGETNGDYPRAWASVVREERSSDEYGQLRVTPGATIIGIRYDNHAYFAYSVRSGVFVAGDTIERISPFALLAKDSNPARVDVERLMRMLRDGDTYQPGYPIATHFERAALHPNARVRDIARQALAAVSENEAKPPIHEEGMPRAPDAKPIDDLDAWLDGPEATGTRRRPSR